MHTATNKATGDLGVSSTLVQEGKAILAGVSINAVAADVVVTIFDSLTATGKIIFKYTLDFSLNNLASTLIVPNVRTDNGLFVDITGAGAEVIVYFR